MTSDTDAAARRIMDRIGEENRVPVLDVPEGDVGVLFGVPLAGLLVGSLAHDLLAIGLLLAGCTLGVAIVYAAPPQLTAWDWLGNVARHVLQRPRVTHSYRPADDNPSTEGGVVQYAPFGVEESTQALTGVEQAWPGAHAIERTDGTMEAFVELDPANMDFAMSDDWEAVQTAAAEFANNELEFPVTLHATTNSFPVERLVRQLDDRLSDDDVQANPVFGELIEEYRDRRPDDLSDTQEVHYYLGVEVDRIEVYQRYDVEPTPGERLTEFPVVGVFFTPFVTRREELDDAEIRTAMFDKLDARIETVQRELVDELSGWSSRRLTTVELVGLVAAFWNGEDLSPADAERVVRRRPALHRQPREGSR